MEHDIQRVTENLDCEAPFWKASNQLCPGIVGPGKREWRAWPYDVTASQSRRNTRIDGHQAGGDATGGLGEHRIRNQRAIQRALWSADRCTAGHVVDDVRIVWLHAVGQHAGRVYAR